MVRTHTAGARGVGGGCFGADPAGVVHSRRNRSPVRPLKPETDGGDPRRLSSLPPGIQGIKALGRSAQRLAVSVGIALALQGTGQPAAQAQNSPSPQPAPAGQTAPPTQLASVVLA